MSFRFLRRAFLAARLDGLVASADAAVEAARAAAQDRDPADPNGKPRRAINRAPEDVQEAYRVAVAAARDARVRRRDETPEGVRFPFPKTGGLLELVVPQKQRAYLVLAIAWQVQNGTRLQEAFLCVIYMIFHHILASQCCSTGANSIER